jgi:hypothetical protein
MLKNVDPRRQAKLKVVPVIKHLSVFLPHYWDILWAQVQSECISAPQ